MISPSDVLAVVKEHGPILPAQISEHIAADTMLIGALLSDLLKEKSIRITYAKWGGSPLYFTDSQIELIQKVYEKLNEKDKRAFDLIKEEHIVADDEQTPLMRTCLKEIKDFAIPLRIKTPLGEKLFWKWYLTSNEEALGILKQKLAPKIITKPVEEEQIQNVSEPKPIEQAKPDVREDTSETKEPVVVSKPQPVSAKKGALLAVSDDFFDEIEQKLVQKGVEIIQADVVRKNAELDLHISIPTPVGNILLYAKVKQKKKSTDADISQAFVQATLHKLPGCYIHTGELTKKAQDLLQTDFSSILVVTL